MGPYSRVSWQGHTFNARTLAALKWVQKDTGLPLAVAQGSYNGGKGAVSASAGTHDKGGAVDLSVRNYSTKQRIKVVHSMRRAGFAAWYRKAVPGLWGAHIHGILLGDREASAGAKQQMAAYENHRDGLAGNRYDDTWRPKRPRRFSYRKGRPVKR